MRVLSFLAQRGQSLVAAAPAVPTVLDDDSQPRNSAFRSGAVVDHQIDELIGITKGVLGEASSRTRRPSSSYNGSRQIDSTRGLWPAKVLTPA